MNEPLGHEQFVEEATKVLKHCEGHAIAIVLRGPGGLRIFANFVDPITSMGIYEAAHLMTRKAFMDGLSAAQVNGEAKMAEQEIMDVIQDIKTKVN